MNTPASQNNQSGAAMLGIVLVIIVILLALVGALAIGPQLQNITTERQTVKRANVIVDAVRQYYLARGELPKPSSVPVDKLNLEQEYKYDAWGQEWCYYRATVDDLTDITGIEVDTGSGNALQVAGVLISRGPDQEFGSTLDESTSAMADCPDDGDDIDSITQEDDDIVIPLNVQGEAIQIAKDELDVLAGRGCPIEINQVPDENYFEVTWQDTSTPSNGFLIHTGLGTSFQHDPWVDKDDPNSSEYLWEPDDPDNDPLFRGRWLSLGEENSSPMLSNLILCPEPDPDAEGFADFEPAGGSDDGGQMYEEQSILFFGDIGGSGLNKTDDTLRLGVDSSGDSRSFSNGCLWYNGDNDECEDGICTLGNGLRTYFKAEFIGSGEGFTFSIINAEDNNIDSCGGYGGFLNFYPQGELLAYAGPGNNGTGLQSPKIGVEFDMYTNSGSDDACAVDSRNDPDEEHVSFVFWGSDESSSCDIFPFPATPDSPTWDDNRHGAGNNPANPGPDEEEGIIHRELEDKTLHFRYEVHVDEDEGDYFLKVWIHDEDVNDEDDDGEPEDLFKNVAGNYEEDPVFTLELDASDGDYDDLDLSEIILGFTQATGTETQEITLTDFKLSFK